LAVTLTNKYEINYESKRATNYSDTKLQAFAGDEYFDCSLLDYEV
jgi:hypothetical protein